MNDKKTLSAEHTGRPSESLNNEETDSLTSTIILLKSIWCTLWLSFLTMVDVSLRKAGREVIIPRVKLWALRLLKYADVNYVVHYEKPWSIEPGRRYVLMSNHRSYFDILVLAAIPGTVRMIGKLSCSRFPFGDKVSSPLSLFQRSTIRKSNEAIINNWWRGLDLARTRGQESRWENATPGGRFLLARQTVLSSP